MQQNWNKIAALLLCVLLAVIVGCASRTNTPDYRYYDYDRDNRFTSYVPGIVQNPTQIADENTQSMNDSLVIDGPFSTEPLILLDGGANTLSPLEYSFGYGNISEVSDNGRPQLRVFSSPGNIAFATFNFNYLEPTQFISYIEVIGSADFINWQDEGFFFGMRQGGEEKFTWGGPVNGSQNWIFTYSLHESENYQGGIPSFAIMVADGDRLRIRGIRVVVGNTEEHLRRTNQLDPHRVWPFTANAYYNPGKVHHFYNGKYHRDKRNGNFWNDDYSGYNRRNPWGYDNTHTYSNNEWNDINDDLQDAWVEVDDLRDELWDIKQTINEPTPTPVTPNYQAPTPTGKKAAPPVSIPAIEESVPVNKTVPVV